MEQAKPAPTVLHVDDDEALRRLVEDIFEEEAPDLGYVSAASGEEALEALSKITGPLILLVDRRLPTTDLWTFVGEVEQALDAVAVPTFVLSGSADPKSVAEAYSKGAVAYLEKPVDADGFYEIADFLQRYSRMATFPGASP